MTAVDEAKFSEPVAEFLKLFNARVGRSIKKGSRWVRVRPPDDNDFDMAKENPKLLPFMRVGSEGEVLEVDSLVLIRVGANSVMYDLDSFLSTFVRIVAGSEWKHDEDLQLLAEMRR